MKEGDHMGKYEIQVTHWLFGECVNDADKEGISMNEYKKKIKSNFEKAHKKRSA